MTKRKQAKFKKRLPAHKRIPARHGLFTQLENRFYDLAFSYGVAGLFMANNKIAEKLNCSKYSVQRARQKLIRAEVFIECWKNPWTRTTWARYHIAVMNCPTLIYHKTFKFPNPFYSPNGDRAGSTKFTLQGKESLPNSVIGNPQGDFPITYVKSETANKPLTDSSQGSALKPASTACSTGKGGSVGKGSDKPTGFKPGSPREKTPPIQRPEGADPELNEQGCFFFKNFLDKLTDVKHPKPWAIKMANIKALEKQKGLKHG